jgi:hypothetical protein
VEQLDATSAPIHPILQWKNCQQRQHIPQIHLSLWAKSDEEQQALKIGEGTHYTVEEPCVKCSAPEVGFYTVQMRSVGG